MIRANYQRNGFLASILELFGKSFLMGMSIAFSFVLFAFIFGITPMQKVVVKSEPCVADSRNHSFDIGAFNRINEGMSLYDVQEILGSGKLFEMKQEDEMKPVYFSYSWQNSNCGRIIAKFKRDNVDKNKFQLLEKSQQGL
jgi:hypothetical protein